MDSGLLARAEATATIVMNAAQTGESLCIPGTRELRTRITGPTAEAALPVLRDVAAPGDVEQREYERAGGGAPGERDTTRRATVFEQLRRLLRT